MANGSIQVVDNIGLMEQWVQTSGFMK